MSNLNLYRIEPVKEQLSSPKWEGCTIYSFLEIAASDQNSARGIACICHETIVPVREGRDTPPICVGWKNPQLAKCELVERDVAQEQIIKGEVIV